MALLLAACGKIIPSKQQEQEALRVRTMVVHAQQVGTNSRYVGTIEACRETPLSLQTTGRVIAIGPKNGAYVRKGQMILCVDSTQAVNTLRMAQATLQHARDGYDRTHKVHERGVISDQQMVEIESQYAQAQAMHAAAKQQLEECTLRATCDGVINGLEIEIGQTVIPGTKLCTIMDMTHFHVRFTVPEKEMNALGDGGVVECAAMEQQWPIRIIERGVKANTITHTYEAVAEIIGVTEGLMAGMVATVMVNNGLKEKEDIIIPAACILLKPEGHTVWVKEQGRAVRRLITIDGYQADGVRVADGLQEGDSLITEGYQKLYNNCPVENQ